MKLHVAIHTWELRGIMYTRDEINKWFIIIMTLYLKKTDTVTQEVTQYNEYIAFYWGRKIKIHTAH